MNYEPIIDEWMSDNRIPAGFYLDYDEGGHGYLSGKALAVDLCAYGRLPCAEPSAEIINACQQWLENVYDGGEQ